MKTTTIDRPAAADARAPDVPVDCFFAVVQVVDTTPVDCFFAVVQVVDTTPVDCFFAVAPVVDTTPDHGLTPVRA